MVGVVLETLSTRKLLLFGLLMLLAQIFYFLVGGLIAPSPNSSETILMSKCVDYSKDSPQKWLYIRRFENLSSESNCEYLLPDGDLENVLPASSNADQLVFIAQFPHPRDGYRLRMTRWFQQVLGVLMLDIKHKAGVKINEDTRVTFDLRLGYRNEKDPPGVWHDLARSTEVRPLHCVLDAEAKLDRNHSHEFDSEIYYECEVLPLFTLASCHYEEYLLNLRIPMTRNEGIGALQDVWMVEIHQNGGFTKVWFSLKTLAFPAALLALIFFSTRVRELGRPASTLEKTIFILGVGLTFLNCPVEWISLIVNASFWLVLSDVRQGVFLAVLVCFWLVFTEEHMMDESRRSSSVAGVNRVYWPRLLLLIGSCAALFIFELAERGVQIRNPFYSIWSHPTVAKLGITSVIVGALCALAYMGYLGFLVVRTLIQILSKRRLLTDLPKEQRRYYKGVIYRFTILLSYTLVCAAFTVAFFIFNRATEDHWAWGERSIEYGSAFITGVYGMWNVYVIAVLCLYAPSHKFRSTSGQELYDRLVSSTYNDVTPSVGHNTDEAGQTVSPDDWDSSAVSGGESIRLAPMSGPPVTPVKNLAFLHKNA